MKLKKIKDKYLDKKLREKRLDDKLHRPYFVKNQETIIEEINSFFKEKNIELKLYML